MANQINIAVNSASPPTVTPVRQGVGASVDFALQEKETTRASVLLHAPGDRPVIPQCTFGGTLATPVRRWFDAESLGQFPDAGGQLVVECRAEGVE